MNYTIQLESPEKALVFKTIIFDTFKINVVERYKNVKSLDPVYNHVVIKLRTLDDQIIKTKNDTVSRKLREDEFESYAKVAQKVRPVKNLKSNSVRVLQEQEFVHYILVKVLEHYDLSSIGMAG